MKRAEFDVVSCPLDGRVLVEAGAGTGKTYAITRIYLRMIAEKGFRVDEVLVVTFTVAATQELKQRLRRTLREALDYFTTGQSGDNNLKAILDSLKSVPEAEDRIRNAVRDFDEAAVYTIHGFCSRVLKDFAFETGTPFDVETVTDQEDLKTEIARDYWRKHVYRQTPLFLDYLNQKGGFNKIVASLSAHLGRKGVRIEPDIPGDAITDDTSDLEEDYRTAYDAARTIWNKHRDEVEQLLMTDDGLNRKIYRYNSIPGKIVEMNNWISGGSNRYRRKSGILDYFRQELIPNKVKQGYAYPVHPFFEACDNLHRTLEDLETAFDQRFTEFRVDLFNYLVEELQKRHRDRNTQSYDDLLAGVHDALFGNNRQLLIRKIERQYRAALIDEFQDTDPVQYEIFTTLFHKGPLFFIGDPKQAIYGFRGADIFSYLDAAEKADIQYTLTRNWRSVPELIEAVNTFFADTKEPFVFDDIRFERGAPADRDYSERLMIDKDPDFPDAETGNPHLTIWKLALNQSKGPNKPVIDEKAYQAVAAEISRLVRLGRRGKAHIGDAPLREKDIAVLVMKNKQADGMRDVLAELNIPSVVHGMQNVLDTREAIEITRFLAAAAHPNDERKIRAAIVSDMIGVSGNELGDPARSEKLLEEWLDRFKGYHDQWRRGGFMKMFAGFLAEQNVRERLTGLDQGERRITNVIHLAEIIHGQCSREKLPPAELYRWFIQKRGNPGERSDEQLLRLSTDENAVQIVTVHKSKGLEYPVVFLPFSWDVLGNKIEPPFLYHDGDRKAVLDMGSPDHEEHKAVAEKEAMSERIRQFYVALTRARHRCYLVFPRFQNKNHSAPWYLAMNTVKPESGDTGKGKAANLEIGDFLDKAGSAIHVEDIPETPLASVPSAHTGSGALKFRPFNGNIDRSYKIASFSTLTSDHAASPDETDRDSVPIVETPFPKDVLTDNPGIADFPRGKIPGTFIHKLFERIGFDTIHDSALEDAVGELLKEYGYEDKWISPLAGMFRNVMKAPMSPGDETFLLSEIPDSRRITEMGFYFPLKPEGLKGMRDVFKKAGTGALPETFPERIENLEFGNTGGYMRGFIDLIFQYNERYYILDWKSNRLGDKSSDYGQDAMQAVMIDHLYILQYLLYTVAVDQYLNYRIPDYDYDTHFGGVLYLFVRGIDPQNDPGAGIYKDRPPKGLIESLDRGLIQQPVS